MSLFNLDLFLDNASPFFCQAGLFFLVHLLHLYVLALDEYGPGKHGQKHLSPGYCNVFDSNEYNGYRLQNQ
ncbi:uncharacterized protein F4822DRAFT_435004 [Hypoxylon trugodes]|uniref:uncharacterized protein n=1 Tax=Hypoxylon trugodes TaxID=326681 RepID=UPI00219C3D83|nr:uncharacterized protein F4822DRAFT_435004 [Hypoxylon trugodes]KAI1383080.1 hypothetical protein F4822DRAFT_435004 [Hypoxylon trugodes]